MGEKSREPGSAAGFLRLEALLGQLTEQQLDMVARISMTPSFSAPPVPQRRLRLLASSLSWSRGSDATDGGHGLAATAFAFAAHAGDTITFGDDLLLADAGVHRLATVRAMPTGIGGVNETAKGGEGRSFLGHFCSSLLRTKTGRCLGPGPTAKPHSGRGSATAAKSCDSPKRARSVTINLPVAKYRNAPFFECFATLREQTHSHSAQALYEPCECGFTCVRAGPCQHSYFRLAA